MSSLRNPCVCSVPTARSASGNVSNLAATITDISVPLVLGFVARFGLGQFLQLLFIHGFIHGLGSALEFADLLVAALGGQSNSRRLLLRFRFSLHGVSPHSVNRCPCSGKLRAWAPQRVPNRTQAAGAPMHMGPCVPWMASRPELADTSDILKELPFHVAMSQEGRHARSLAGWPGFSWRTNGEIHATSPSYGARMACQARHRRHCGGGHDDRGRGLDHAQLVWVARHPA